jgi:hypothetical protein
MSAAEVAVLLVVQSVHVVQRLIVRAQQLRRAAELWIGELLPNELLRAERLWSAVLSGAAFDAGGSGLSRAASALGSDPGVATGNHSGRDDDDSAAADDCARDADDHYARAGGNAAEFDATAGDVCSAADGWHVYAAAEHNAAEYDHSGAAWIRHAGSRRKFSGGAAGRQLWNQYKFSAAK